LTDTENCAKSKFSILEKYSYLILSYTYQQDVIITLFRFLEVNEIHKIELKVKGAQ